MRDFSFSYITCAAVVVTVYWPSNPRHEIIYTTGQPQRTGALAAVPDANLWRTVPEELDWFSVDVYPNEASMMGYVPPALAVVWWFGRPSHCTVECEHTTGFPSLYGNRFSQHALAHAHRATGGSICSTRGCCPRWRRTSNWCSSHHFTATVVSRRPQCCSTVTTQTVMPQWGAGRTLHGKHIAGVD